MNTTTKLLTGRTILVMGVANEKSIAWGIARACHAHGASLIFTYPNAAVEKRLRPLAEELGGRVYPCDVTSDGQIKTFANELMDTNLHGIVHAIAFSDKEELKGGLSQTSRENFRTTMDVSCYSLIALMQHLAPRLSLNASVLALSYLGGEKVVPNYNVMGLAKAALESAVRYLAAEFGPLGTRVNTISAGPVNTLAARGIGGFNDMLRHHEATAPLHRLTSVEEVGDTAVFLLSELSRGITGETLYVDGGANILGPTPAMQS